MKKALVLGILFVFPIVVYLFFASGVTNFGKLPVLTEGVQDISDYNSGFTFQDKITVLGFLGNDVALKKGNAFNLNQKIYKRFFEFKDFQFVMLMPNGTEQEVEELKNELSDLADVSKWKFVFLPSNQIESIFSSLKSNLTLDDNHGTPYVFIIDKDRALRGRDKEEKEDILYGFDATSVADLNNKMIDDVKIILAEYRLSLKKNNADRGEK